ncbi:protein of unknown function (plasmid) [Cardinium endosymbiont cEper1 of Encarsia pergandiella]|nr:protein of unknown function [Cardinium endosymbiont cEper1 of Encarsia pergandiella]
MSRSDFQQMRQNYTSESLYMTDYEQLHMCLEAILTKNVKMTLHEKNI